MLLGLLVVGPLSTALGQEEAPPVVRLPVFSPVPLAPEPAPAASKLPPGVVREQTIYIPYTRLRDTFEKEGRGVFLPYDKFQELWQAARRADAKPTDAPPPVGALIAAIDSLATVDRDVLRVAAQLRIEILAPGWHRVPLRLGDAALLSAKLGDKPAHVSYEGDGYYLLLHAPAPTFAAADAAAPSKFEPQHRELTLEYAKAYVKHPGHNQASFEAPQAPINRWEVRVPQSGAKITLEPLIAAAELPTSTPQAPEGKPAGKPPELTALQAFVGAAPTVKIDWTAKSEGAAGLAALVNVQARQLVRIDEGVVRAQTHLHYEISRADIAQLQVELPVDQRVINVFDANVRQWEVKTVDGVQRVIVQLYQPTRGKQTLVVETERFLEDMKQAELAVPAVRALDVVRQQGIVLVKLAAELRGEVVRRSGLTQLDAGELPPELARQGWDFTFRYATLPFDLALAVEKVQPRIRVDELVETYLEPERITCELLAVYKIERAGVFQLELSVPSGYELREVRGHKQGDAEPAAVDAHRLEGDDKSRLIVSLGRKALGSIGLYVRLEKRLEDPNLVQPTGAASTFDLPLPRVAPTGIEAETGRMVVNSPESLRVHAEQLEGLRLIPAPEAFQPIPSQRNDRFGTTRAVLAYAFGQTPARLNLAAERRRPAITARQLLVARMETGVVKYEATFHYDVRYSGVKQLRIDVPADLATRIHNDTPLYRERTLENPQPPAAEGYVAWAFAGETELLGARVIKLTWEQPLEELAVGDAREIAIPRLTPRDADLERAWGQVVVTKAETLDIRPTGTPRGLRPIDPQHDLMPEAAVADAARAFEFQADWDLKLALQRYQLEEVKRTAIEAALLRMVVTRSGGTTVQAIYRVRSARQRLGLKLPAEFQLDTQPLRVNGQRHDLERGDNDELFIPLVNKAAGEPVVLELRYTVPRGVERLDLPEFLDDPAVQQVYVAAFVPEEQALLGSRGNWTEEFSWHWSLGQVPTPLPKRDDQTILNKISDGVTLERPLGDNFPLDGQRLLFSALRPEPGLAGALHLTTLKRTWLRAMVLGVVALIGVIGWRRTFSQRLVLLGATLGVFILLGALLTTFTRQAADGILIWALAAVIAAWMLRSTMLMFGELAAARTEARTQMQRRAAEAAAQAAAAQAAARTAESHAPAATPSDSPFRASNEDAAKPDGDRDHA
ncbi:MAG: hypothetical protein U0939_12470 [Pirellulales bacterium]